MPQDPNNKAKLKRLARIASLLRDRELLEKIGQSYRTLLLRRVRKGKDVNDSRFAPYSKGHISLRKRLGLETHIVNLQMSAYETAMLESIDHVVFNDLKGVKAFMDNREKSQLGQWHQKGAGDLPVREWWGMSDSHKEKIEGLVSTSLDEIFKTKL